ALPRPAASMLRSPAAVTGNGASAAVMLTTGAKLTTGAWPPLLKSMPRVIPPSSVRPAGSVQVEISVTPNQATELPPTVYRPRINSSPGSGISVRPLPGGAATTGAGQASASITASAPPATRWKDRVNMATTPRKGPHG